MFDVKKHSSALLSLPFALVIISFSLSFHFALSLWSAFGTTILIQDYSRFYFHELPRHFLRMREEFARFMHIVCNLSFKLKICFYYLGYNPNNWVSRRSISVFLCS